MGVIGCHLQEMLLMYRCFIISNKTFVSYLFCVGSVVNRSKMDDWKLKARAVVKLHKERNMFVSLCLVYLFRLVWRLQNHC